LLCGRRWDCWGHLFWVILFAREFGFRSLGVFDAVEVESEMEMCRYVEDVGCQVGVVGS
jgi:hypothetical protein